MSVTHPYSELEDLTVWRVVDGEIASLEEKGDLHLAAGRPYVVGALCSRLVRGGLVLGRTASSAASSDAEDAAEESRRAGASPAAVGAVVARFCGILMIFPVLLVLAMQVLVLARNERIGIAGALGGTAVFLVYLLPALLLLWFAKPLGRLLARGL